MTAEKVRENRLRRMAERQGLRLVKNRRRDPNALCYGGYGLVDVQRDYVVFGYSQAMGEPEASLDEIEAYLTGEGEE